MKAVKLLLSYIKYYFVSVGRHGLQSSFMYNLNEFVWRRDKNDIDQEKIENYRQALLRDKTILSVRDFGAGFGGKVYKQLPISFITKRSSKPPKYARMLYRLSKYLKPQYILEVGTSVGISALYQAMGNPSAKVITLEGCDQTAALARKGIKEFPELNIEVIEGEFSQTLPQAISKLPQLDFVYLDGNHKLKPTLEYFEMCLEKVHDDTVIIVDDINWSGEMKAAWSQISSHPKVTISIDVFMMGILFFNKGFSKEKFVVRY
jgi:predicted O-methyltransferase YrrM